MSCLIRPRPLPPSTSSATALRVKQIAGQIAPGNSTPGGNNSSNTAPRNGGSSSNRTRLSRPHHHQQQQQRSTTSRTRTMSTSSATAGAAAPWRDLFLEHVDAMPSPEFSLSTIRKVRSGRGATSSRSSAGGGSGGQVEVTPRVRTCVFRGMWADMPVNPKNEAERNPAGVFTSDLPVFTTDVRMDKMPELFGVEVDEDAEPGRAGAGAAGAGGAKADEKVVGSGGGAPVEAMFWVKDSMVQWRLRGRAYVLAPEDADDGDISSGADGASSEAGKKTVKTILERMRPVDGSSSNSNSNSEATKPWSVRREIYAHFENLSPGMRGTWRNPPSGQPIDLPVGDERLKLGQKGDSLVKDDLARQNFRVVVIVPEFVDRCDLSDPARGRRWFYSFLGSDGQAKSPGGQVEGEWEKVEVWP
ncbi:pyridoxamine 5'-phosphate oxidase-domain-containing protein [Microdochium trichocladiopsis]|uniref:Pyridoxamine 5'-phosphate oxidase-domain-containing protein n=1 Tax=Microdochium trichocladiopsis TaxID=1682393 RepID=A0A9P8YBT8_9PEZI|nr:pyridoxamine 5'-phosphate oxidase-domain-containing protein [Microdochium trichocladiopsis]KAH7035603.1 pyridoxamine 5'-phosphate oxidase-domain-containing protein [Microdochium trichocladiopsis]